MSFVQWRYVLLDNGLGAAFLNLGINGGIAWAVFHNQPWVPLWGALGIASDTAATSLILPFLTCVIVTLMTDWHVRAGRLPALPGARAVWIKRWLPEGTLARAGVFAAASSLALVPATVLVLVLLDVQQLPLRSFLIFKVGFAVAAGLLVTPLIAWLALSRVRPAHPVPVPSVSRT